MLNRTERKGRVVVEIIQKNYSELKDSIAGGTILPNKQHSGRNRLLSEQH